MLNRTIIRCTPVLVALVVASSGRAQADVSSNVVGVVLSEDGSAIKGAAVTIQSSLHPGLNRSGVTDSKGKFRFREVVPGDYTVTVESPNYTAFKQEHLQPDLGTTVDLKVTLSAPAGDESAGLGQALGLGAHAGCIGDLTSYVPPSSSRPTPSVVQVPPRNPHRQPELRAPIEIVTRPTTMLGGPPRYAEQKK